MHRRTLLTAVPVFLASCGFELRRPPEMGFRTIALAGFDRRSALAEELRRQFSANASTLMLEDPNKAEVVLHALEDVRERTVVASTAAGQVREIQLRQRLRFRLSTPQDKELIAPSQIMLSRDMSYSESAALGKEQEEAQLFRSMTTDIASQVLRRLAAVRLG